jgi:hypothetical protein
MYVSWVGKAWRVLDVVMRWAPVAVQVIQVVQLVWSQVENWFEEHRLAGTIGTLVRQRIDNGDVTVVANVLRDNQPVATATWQAQTLSPDLERRFGNRDEIVVYS